MEVCLTEKFVSDDAGMLSELLATLPLRQELIRLYGREVAIPRLTCWHGEASYTYSKKTFAPEPWTAALAALRDRLSAAEGVSFNSVLVNYYRDGRDSVSWHADDEPELGPSKADVRIASVSLGASRRFLLRHNTSRQVTEFNLGGGSLLVMRGTVQQEYQHAVPKTSHDVGARMNLTFRHIV